MEKIKSNIQNNTAIYLLIFVVVAIFLIIKFIGNKQIWGVMGSCDNP